MITMTEVFKRLDGLFCDPEGNPCFSGSDGDRAEYKKIRDEALSCVISKEALIDELEDIISETHDYDVRDWHYASNIVDYLQDRGYIGEITND